MIVSYATVSPVRIAVALLAGAIREIRAVFA
jgi:hypothetical protein